MGAATGAEQRAHSFAPGVRPGGVKSSHPYADSKSKDADVLNNLKAKEVPIRDEGLTFTINLDKMADNKFGFKTQQQQDEAYEA